MAKRKPKCLQSLTEMHTPDYWKGRGMYSKTHCAKKIHENQPGRKGMVCN